MVEKMKNVRIVDVNMKLNGGKCPAFGKTCTNFFFKKKNHFQAVCKFKKKNVERVEENEINIEVFSVKKKKVEKKIEQKKKKRYTKKG